MSKGIYSADFWKDLGERTASTAVQTFLGLISLEYFMSPSWLAWKEILLATLFTTLFTIAKGFLASMGGNEGTASFTRALVPAHADVIQPMKQALRSAVAPHVEEVLGGRHRAAASERTEQPSGDPFTLSPRDRA